MSDEEEEDFFSLEKSQKKTEMMEISIETLSGVIFDVPVRSTDTVFEVKTKIQRVEGIPTHHQNLLFRFKELDDFKRLNDVGIKNGSKLKLVLSMRGGPISTRRLTTACIDRRHVIWKDLKELIEHTREEIAEKPESTTTRTSKVSVLVFKEGAAINLLRVIENEDGSYSPYLKKEKENRDKIEILRSKMENLEVLEDDEDSNDGLNNLDDFKMLKNRLLNQFLLKQDDDGSSEELGEHMEKRNDSGGVSSGTVFDEIESQSMVSHRNQQFCLHKTADSKIDGVKKKEVDELKMVEKTGKNRRMRCEKCKKRLNLTNWYLCRCEKAFCAQHRLPEVHDCGYDFKGEGRRVLERENPLVSGVKVVKF